MLEIIIKKIHIKIVIKEYSIINKIENFKVHNN